MMDCTPSSVAWGWCSTFPARQTGQEVAIRRKAHPHTVRAAMRAGDLPAKRLGRMFVTTAEDADAWTPRTPGRPR